MNNKRRIVFWLLLALACLPQLGAWNGKAQGPRWSFMAL